MLELWDIVDILYLRFFCFQGLKKFQSKVDFRENGDRKRYVLNNEINYEECLYLNVYVFV